MDEVPSHIKSDIGKQVWLTGWRAVPEEITEVNGTFDVPFNVQDDKQRHPYGILVLALLAADMRLRPWTADFCGRGMVRFYFTEEADAVVARLLYDDTING